MIVTKKFVFILNSKTGTTSVETSFKRLNEQIHLARPIPKRLANKLLLKAGIINPISKTYLIRSPEGRITKHGEVQDIPVQYRGLPIISCLRSLPEYILSHMNHGDSEKWQKKLSGIDSKKNLPLVQSLETYKKASIFLQAKYRIQKPIGFFSFWLVKNFAKDFNQVVLDLNQGKPILKSTHFRHVHFIPFTDQLDHLKKILLDLRFHEDHLYVFDVPTHVNKSEKRPISDDDLGALHAYINQNEQLYSEIFQSSFDV